MTLNLIRINGIVYAVEESSVRTGRAELNKHDGGFDFVPLRRHTIRFIHERGKPSALKVDSGIAEFFAGLTPAPPVEVRGEVSDAAGEGEGGGA